jgi:hypothetical protein
MLSQNGSTASSAARPMSHVTITALRFQRSMSAPPTGANRKPGSMRATITKPTAVAEFETRPAIAMIAKSPVQSPKLDTNCAPNSGRNPGTRNTRHGAGGIGSRSGAGGMNGACWSLTRGST